MFNVPITLLSRQAIGIFVLPSSIAVDDILVVQSVGIDNIDDFRVESDQLSDCVPHTVITRTDGRKLFITEQAEIIHLYLDLHQQLEEIHTPQPVKRTEGSPSLRLIHGGKCDISEASTPD